MTASALEAARRASGYQIHRLGNLTEAYNR